MPTLDWLNRDEGLRIAERAPTRALRPHSAGGAFGDAASSNLLIQGDNLDALKAPLLHFRGLRSLSAVSTGIASYARMIDMNTVTVSPKFQVVIPLEVRRRMRLQPGAKLMVVEFNGGLRLMPLQPPSALRGIARGVGTVIERDADRVL